MTTANFLPSLEKLSYAIKEIVRRDGIQEAVSIIPVSSGINIIAVTLYLIKLYPEHEEFLKTSLASQLDFYKYSEVIDLDGNKIW